MKLSPTYWEAGRAGNDQHITSIGNIGIGTHAGKDQLQELKAKIFKGAGAVELGFMGRGKGVKGQGNTTPGMHGKEEREAMRDLAKVNKVRLSTHASVGAGSWSGFHENKFDENAREQNIFEGKRAIEFAADVAEGGPIVIHTGEFPRGITEVPNGDDNFRTLIKESGQQTHYLMDKKTGQLITAVREDQVNFVPEYDVTTNEKDQWGKEIKHIKWKDKPGGEFNIIKHNWAHYKEEAKKNDREYYKKFQNPNDKNYDPSKSADPSILFYYENLEAKRLQAQGQADEYELMYRRHADDREKIKKAVDYWEKKWKEIPKEDRWKHMEAIPIEGKGLVEPHVRNRLEHLKRMLEDTEKQMSYGKEVAASSRANEQEIKDQQKRVTSIPDYGLKKTADSIATMAIYAAEEQQKKNLKRDMFIAPENIFPEMGYGSHPDELKKIVQDSRKEMVKKLTDPFIERNGEKIKNPDFHANLSESKAKEMAARHIKATFDIGHANTWQKYFKGKPKEFKKWLIDQVSELNKEGVLGHVHVTDNFGYYDEHLSPGQGNVPVEEFVKQLKKSGYKGQITVETAEQDYKAMTEMWRTVNSPVYKIGGGWQDWAGIEQGYFGKTRSPNFLFGPIAPDPKTWTLWSEVPME
ncbi:hypothetical protein HN777_04570 [Candidatus Woesearchaeota archaeon]|nr:hypothetical protein [Candidatus Woesearchaeota archaeon]